MDAEGIREIALMQSQIENQSTGFKYILIQLSSPDKELLFPKTEIPYVDHILEKIKELQKQNRLNERGKD